MALGNDNLNLIKLINKEENITTRDDLVTIHPYIIVNIGRLLTRFTETKF